MSTLGKVSPANTAHVLAYAVPLAKKASLNIAATNRSNFDVDVTFSISKADDLAVSAVTLIDGGTGLTSIPTLAISGTGTGAAAKVDSVLLKEAELSAGGSGYSIDNVLTVVGGSGGVAAKVKVTAVGVGGTIAEVIITEGGDYTAVITGTDAALSGGDGSGATLSVASLRYGIKSVSLVSKGNDYTSAPSVMASAGTGAAFGVTMERAAIEDKDALEFAVTLPPKGVLERTGVVLGGGEAVFVRSSIGDSTNFFVFGIEAVA